MSYHFFKCVVALFLAGLSFTAAAETGVTGNRILIGQTVGVTGTVAGPVKEMNEGANAYFNQVNKKGGIHGRKIEMVVLDDKFDPKRAYENAEKLIKEHRVFALFLGRGTPHTQKILPLLEAHKVPLLAPSTGAQVFHDPVNRWVFNIRAKYQDEVLMAVRHLATTGIKRISLLHVDDAFGEDGLEGFRKAMASYNLTPVSITKFGRVNPDNQEAARTVIAANPAALLIVSSAKNTVGVIKAIREQGGRMLLLTLSNNSSQAFVNELGPAGQGVIITQVTPAPHLVSTPLGQEFKAAAKLTGATISYPAIEGYVNAKVLVEGLRRAGRDLTREGFVRAMESMERVDFGGMLITYGTRDHTGSEFVELTMIGQGGRFVR